MYEQLYQSIHQRVSLTEEEWEQFKTNFIPKKMRKRQFLLQEGDVSSRLAFIEKGALYSYSTDKKGNQHVLQFGFEGWWISDLNSFITKEPSSLNIEVLEDAELLLLDEAQYKILLKELPGFETYLRSLFQNALVNLQRRIENTLGLTAEEKYARFLNHYPHCLNRVPQHLIASYLGVSPETLSRVRRQMAS